MWPKKKKKKLAAKNELNLPCIPMVCLSPEVSPMIESWTSYHFFFFSHTTFWWFQTHYVLSVRFISSRVFTEILLLGNGPFMGHWNPSVSCLYTYDHIAPLAWKQLAMRSGGQIFSTTAWHFGYMQVKVNFEGRSI